MEQSKSRNFATELKSKVPSNTAFSESDEKFKTHTLNTTLEKTIKKKYYERQLPEADNILRFITSVHSSSKNDKYQSSEPNSQYYYNTFSELLSFDDELKYQIVEPSETDISHMLADFLIIIREDNVIPGYVSKSQLFLEINLEKNRPLVGEVIIRAHRSLYNNPTNLAKLIEAVSNIDYVLLAPYNFSIVQSSVSHSDIEIQEAVISSFEKWEDPENLTFLTNNSYTNDFIKQYANDVIEYLKELKK